MRVNSVPLSALVRRLKVESKIPISVGFEVGAQGLSKDHKVNWEDVWGCVLIQVEQTSTRRFKIYSCLIAGALELEDVAHAVFWKDNEANIS